MAARVFPAARVALDVVDARSSLRAHLRRDPRRSDAHGRCDARACARFESRRRLGGDGGERTHDAATAPPAFPIAGIRDEFDDDGGDESGSEVGVLTREDVSWLKKQANEAAARDREVLERNLADRGFSSTKKRTTRRRTTRTPTRTPRGARTRRRRDISSTNPRRRRRRAMASHPPRWRRLSPERAFEPEPAVAAAAEETRPEVASEGEREEDRQPRITPEMTYDEKQAEYARFAAEEAARNDRIAADAAEAERAARERQEEEDRLADARAEEERRAIAPRRRRGGRRGGGDRGDGGGGDGAAGARARVRDAGV